MINVTVKVSNYVPPTPWFVCITITTIFLTIYIFHIKIKKLPWEKVNREPSSADYDNLRDQQIQIIYTFGCILSILKSVEEIHLRLYQSHKDPKFPAASGQSLCSRQIQIVV